jgi:hypothetical protein
VVQIHSLVRPFPTWPEYRVETLTFRRHDHEWRFMLDGNIPNLGGSIMMIEGDD